MAMAFRFSYNLRNMIKRGFIIAPIRGIDQVALARERIPLATTFSDTAPVTLKR